LRAVAADNGDAAIRKNSEMPGPSWQAVGRANAHPMAIRKEVTSGPC